MDICVIHLPEGELYMGWGLGRGRLCNSKGRPNWEACNFT